MHLFTLENAAALLTLTALEVVLGIDNIVFITILTGRLPPDQRAGARRLGLAGALITRILLLLTITWIMALTRPLFHLPMNRLLFDESGAEGARSLGVSGKDLILLAGGLFLIAKATTEIHHKVEGRPAASGAPVRASSFAGVVVQIMLLDVVFSLDSVITAVGMASELWVMIAAIVIAVAVMMVFVGIVSRFVERHLSIRMLALAFLVLIGVMLVADGVHRHVERGYLYFAMAFSLLVELLNIRAGRSSARGGSA